MVEHFTRNERVVVSITTSGLTSKHGHIILLDNINKVEFNNDEVYVEGGILLSQFISCLVENDLGGLENLYGIPNDNILYI